MYFDDDDAKDYGVEAAVLLKNLAFWIKVNKEKNQNFHDGHYWTYNSCKDLAVVFPFWSAEKIRRLGIQLEKLGAIKIGNFNKRPGDQTKWYTIVDKELLQRHGIVETNPQDEGYQSTECRTPIGFDNLKGTHFSRW
jgi:hypothetical protein